MRLHPFVAIERVPGAFGDGGVAVERLLQPVVGAAVGEPGHRFRRDVAEIVEDVHALVIAEQHVDAAAGPARLPLEPHQEVVRGAHVGAAVEDVAGLHQARGAADPFLFGIDQARRLEDLRQVRAGAVDVADGDDARARRGLRLRRRRGNRKGGDGKKQAEKREVRGHRCRDHIEARAAG